MLLFPDPTVHAIGLDLSDRVFRLMEIGRSPFYRFYKRTLNLRKYAEERLPPGVMVNGEIKDQQIVQEKLQALVKKVYRRPRARGVVVALPETQSFIKVISIKKPEHEEDLEKMIREEAELHIPSSLNDLYLDWKIQSDIKETPVGKPLTLTLAAAPKKVVDAYSSLLDTVGLVPIAFEIEAQAIVRSVITPHAKEYADKAIGIVDFGATRSSFIVYDKKTIQFTVSIPLSGDKVTEHISKELGVDLKEAERTKRQCGVDAHKCGMKLWKIMEPFLSAMAERILNAITFYSDHFPNQNKLHTIILCGGGANMLRMSELLSDLTKLEVKIADPWVNIEPDKSPLPREIILSSTTTVGLALRHHLEERS